MRRAIARSAAFGLVALVTLTGVPARAAVPAVFVKTYANLLNGVQYDLTPEGVQTTADGGSIALALTTSSGGTGMSWLVKLDASGNPLWQKEVGVFGLPPGAYTDAVSVSQTRDGGYILGGGTIGGGSGSICPALSGTQCALVERVDRAGNLLWARVFAGGTGGSAITQIHQAADGGYIAVGSATDRNENTGGMMLKLSAGGKVQWERQLGPTGANQAFLNGVQQTTDGGFVATGGFYAPRAGLPFTSVLVVKLDARGKVLWQQGFNDLDGAGAPAGVETATSIVQTSDGGYAVAGTWTNSMIPGECCAGALLLKLDPAGNLQWQQAYSGGVYCYFRDSTESCVDLSGVAYSVRQTAEGGFVLAGDGDLELNDSVPLVPWMAGVDAGGNLLWQSFYYEVNPATGRTLSEYFASSTPTAGGGTLALGWTEQLDNGDGLLYGVQADASGAITGCGDVHAATPLTAMDPGLAPIAPSLAARAGSVPVASSPGTAVTTSITTNGVC